MAKKKDEKDVLVVRDEKTGEISVVAGLNADGSPKRIPAKAENAQSFLQFDRHGDVLDNFFRNFFRQCREPSRFGFYRVAADQADKLLEVIKDLLKDPDGNKEMLAPHKVDTSGYEKKVQEEQSAEKQEQPEQKQDDEPKKQEEMEQKNEQNQESPQQTQGNRGYQPIDESKINWQKLEEKWGVKRDDLEKSGDLNRMLNYGKSDLVRVSPNFGGEAFELDARLSFKKDGEGNVSLVPHFIPSAGSWTSWTGKRARSSPRSSASTARRTKSRMSRQTRCAYRSASARRKSPSRSRTCCVPVCPCVTNSSNARTAGSSSPPCK